MKPREYVKSRILLTALAMGALVTVSACSAGQSAGTPLPETSPTTATSTSVPGTSSSSGSSKDADPCSLLTQAEASGLGASGAPKREMVGTKDTCRWKTADATFQVGVRTNLGLAQVQPDGGQVTDLTVGNRPAKKVSGDGSGVCIIAVEISSSSRVDVTALGKPKEDACPLALKVAEAVEPKLP